VPTSNRKTYILLYEDNEGDRMLVGDVPWEWVIDWLFQIITHSVFQISI
jgi:hypothetical protein